MLLSLPLWGRHTKTKERATPSIFNVIKYHIALRAGAYYNGAHVNTNYEDININIYGKAWRKFYYEKLSYDNILDKSSLYHHIDRVVQHILWYNNETYNPLFLHTQCVIEVRCMSKIEAKYLSTLHTSFDINLIFTW